MSIFWQYMQKKFTAKFVVSCCTFCRLRRNFGFFPSIILADLLGNTCLLVIGVFSSTLFVSVFQGSLLWITLFREIIDQFSSKIFLIFLILVLCKKKAMPTSCPRQKFHSSSQIPSLFLSSLESFAVLFLRAKLGERVALWFALTPPVVYYVGN